MARAVVAYRRGPSKNPQAAFDPGVPAKIELSREALLNGVVASGRAGAWINDPQPITFCEHGVQGPHIVSKEDRAYASRHQKRD